MQGLKALDERRRIVQRVLAVRREAIVVVGGIGPSVREPQEEISSEIGQARPEAPQTIARHVIFQGGRRLRREILVLAADGTNGENGRACRGWGRVGNLNEKRRERERDQCDGHQFLQGGSLLLCFV